VKFAPDKRQAKQAAREEMEEFFRGLQEEEAKKQAEVRARIMEEDETLIESQAFQRRSLFERHEKQLAELQKKHQEQLQSMPVAVSPEVVDLVVKQCQEKVVLLKRENESMGTLWLHAINTIKDLRAQCEKDEMELLDGQYQAAKDMCSQHMQQTLQQLHQRHLLQDSEVKTEEERAKLLCDHEFDINMVSKEYEVACKHAYAQHKLRLDELAQSHTVQIAEDAANASRLLDDLHSALTSYSTECETYISDTLGQYANLAQPVVIPPLEIPRSPYEPSPSSTNVAGS